jgi:hypothetical protein
MEVDGLVGTDAKMSTSSASPPAPVPMLQSLQPEASLKEIQVITYEMSRLMHQPPYKTSLDIPEDIEPYFGRLNNRQLRMADAKTIMEAKIKSCESAKAPPIQIWNPVDDEPCPTFEFIYSNEMYYDKDIGGPDYKNLKGCDCIGGCKPDSKTCSCLARQEYWTADKRDFRFKGFAYDNEGLIQDQSFPTFECNWKCGCDETCMNRVQIPYLVKLNHC